MNSPGPGSIREGSLEAPDRQPIHWKEADYGDTETLHTEMARVFDVCHTCRRCVNLCQAFPVLFDLVDESDTMEVDGIDPGQFVEVADQCFLCDLCAQTKCPYLPPHQFAVDFPHLMLRAKAHKFEQGKSRWRDRILTSTDTLFGALSVPGVAPLANSLAQNKLVRKVGDAVVGIHPEAPLPSFSRAKHLEESSDSGRRAVPSAGSDTTGRVALYLTCYGQFSEPEVVEDLLWVLRHNGIEVEILESAACCGMPKLELGDLRAVERQKDANLPVFLDAIEKGYDILSPVPSCVLMYRQEVPLMFPNDEAVARVQSRFFDPFEYLMKRHADGLLSTRFTQPLGKVAYHAACHQRVQNFGAKTKDLLSLVPDTEVEMIARCSGHDGTYGLKSETYDYAMKIVRPVARTVLEAYLPLIPDGSNLKATLLIEYPDPEERRRELAKLMGVEHRVWLKVVGDASNSSHDRVYAIADEDLERSTDDRTSAVHFLRFELDREMVKSLKSGTELEVGIDHPVLSGNATLRAVTRESLLSDLS